jgi:hypothetical protein
MSLINSHCSALYDEATAAHLLCFEGHGSLEVARHIDLLCLLLVGSHEMVTKLGLPSP